MKKANKYSMFGIIGLLAVFTILSVGMINTNVPTSSSNADASINYHSNVCKYVTRANGEVEEIGCNSNVLFDTGAELIEQYMGAGSGGGDAADWIGLCNATAGCGTPTAGAAEAYNVLDAGCLDAATNPVVGTYASNGNGNWSVSKTFTATCDNLETNVTRLYTDDDDEFAGNSFSLVTLQTDDQLTINWTIWVS